MRIDSSSQANTPTSSNDENGGLCALCGQQNICEGLGFVRYDVAVDHPRFGKLYRCPNFPVEADTSYQERLRKIGNLDALTDKTFETFDAYPSGYTQNERQSLDAAFSRARSFAQSPWGWIVFEGTYGTGKTHLAAAIANERVKHGDKVLFITAPDLLDYLRSAYNPESETTYDETFERVRGADLLILDDLGVENPSAWAQEKLFQILNHRYARRLPTVITTNQTIEKLDPRLRSRMADVDYVSRLLILAPDYRRGEARDRNIALESVLALHTDRTFDNFDINSGTRAQDRENLAKIWRRTMEYAHTLNPSWLVLLGESGSGKTHLAAAVANHLKPHFPDLMFTTVADLMDYLRETFEQDSEASFIKRLRQVRDVSFLVLDDLNFAAAKPWERERIFQILDHRYVSKRPTLITTTSALDKLEPRILTRVMDTRVCSIGELTVESYTLRTRRPTPPSY